MFGGQQPVSGATVQLYVVGTAGDGSPSTALGTSTTTDANGNFSLTGDYTCPSTNPASLVYLLATGGNPGLGLGTNAQLALMATLGPCNSLTPSTFTIVNEITTVAAVFALQSFATSATAIGSSTFDASSLDAAFTLSVEYANTTTGTTPGVNVPVGVTIPVTQINTIADILAACINSAGGTAGTNTACGNLISLTTPAAATPPTDSVSALFNLAKNPTTNTTGLYGLISSFAPFQPYQPQLPPNLGIYPTLATPLLVASPTSLTFPTGNIGFPQSQTVAFSATGSTPVFDAVSASAISISGANPGDFSYSYADNAYGATCYPVVSGTPCTLSVTFTPTAAGVRTAFLTFYDTYGNAYIVALSGTGSGTGSTGPVTISALPYIGPGSSADATLTNNGPDTLAISSISIGSYTLQGTQTFSQTNNCGSVLYTQSICTITVSASSGTLSSASLNVVSNFAPGVLTEPVNAIPVPSDFSGNFGPLAIGLTSPTLLDNYAGGAYPPVGNITDFTFTVNGCNYIHGICYGSDNITFQPTALGLRSISVMDDSQTHIYSGFGIPDGPSLFFSNPINQVHATLNVPASQSIYVINSGTTVQSINPTFSGPDAAEFSAGTCGSLASGQRCSLTVNYTPTHLGLSTTTANVNGFTFPFSFFAAPPGPSATPSLTFPSTTIGTASATQYITLTDYYGGPASVVGISSLTTSFSVVGPTSCPSTPCQIGISFNPATVGTAVALIYFRVGYSQTSASTNLDGTGAGIPTITYPTSNIFGARPVGSTSIPVSLQITNNGSAPVNFNGISVIGANPSDFIIEGNTCGTSINVGVNCTVSVSFSPPPAVAVPPPSRFSPTPQPRLTLSSFPAPANNLWKNPLPQKWCKRPALQVHT